MALTILYGIGCGVSGKTKNAASSQSIENTGFQLCKRSLGETHEDGSETYFDKNLQKKTTVTIKDNEICRLFVLPKFQHKGYGKELIDYAERVILKNHSEIILDASMSAKNIYKMRGYKETEYNQIITESGDILCYDVMKKEQ